MIGAQGGASADKVALALDAQARAMAAQRVVGAVQAVVEEPQDEDRDEEFTIMSTDFTKRRALETTTRVLRRKSNDQYIGFLTNFV